MSPIISERIQLLMCYVLLISTIIAKISCLKKHFPELPDVFSFFKIQYLLLLLYIYIYNHLSQYFQNCIKSKISSSLMHFWLHQLIRLPILLYFIDFSKNSYLLKSLIFFNILFLRFFLLLTNEEQKLYTSQLELRITKVWFL